MPSGQETPIANGWKGLMRSVSPHLVPPTHSPDTVNAAPSTEIQSLIGRRRGRAKAANRSYNILGLKPFVTPFGRFWVYADAGGNFSGIETPLPSLVTPVLPGWITVSFGVISASQTDPGTTNGTAKTLSSSVNLGATGIGTRQFVGASIYPTVISYVAGQSITAKIQANIDSSWVDLFALTLDDTIGPPTGITALLTLASSGTWTQVRASLTVNAGLGAASVSWDPQMRLFYGITRQTITAS